jgi:rhomboid family GlyGly-CTERM serine protease
LADRARGSAARAAVGLAWSALAVVLAFGAVLAWPADRTLIDWQPGLVTAQPWRAFSAVFVHYSSMHLAANLAGALLVGALGHVAGVPLRSVAAWLLAWPLTQLGLLLRPELLHYGGLSGVLHAGVAVLTLHLIVAGTHMQRRVAWALLAGLVLKVLSEAPWGPALRQSADWDIAVAPFAHATGVLAGVLCSALAEAWRRAFPYDPAA